MTYEITVKYGIYRNYDIDDLNFMDRKVDKVLKKYKADWTVMECDLTGAPTRVLIYELDVTPKQKREITIALRNIPVRCTWSTI